MSDLSQDLAALLAMPVKSSAGTPAPATSAAGEGWTVRVASNGVFVELLTPDGEVAFDEFHDFTSACKVCEAINSRLAASSAAQNRNLSPDSPSEHATGVEAKPEGCQQ